MKEITIISGKGGTGKTSITAALAYIAEDTVFCDNDVDAADLHLILKPEILETTVFEGAWLAAINQDQCISCGVCTDLCRFEAIKVASDGTYTINPVKCEGCRLCKRECPENAIESQKSLNNFWFISDTRYGKLVHAQMGPGEENSGKLVTEVRKAARELAKQDNAAFIINDGPPGIGCAAISSITGTSAVLLVTEPSLSGLHDLQRLIELVKSFNIPAYALINKYDLSTEIANKIEKVLLSADIPVLARIPFSTLFVEAMLDGMSIIEYAPEDKISTILHSVYSTLVQN